MAVYKRRCFLPIVLLCSLVFVDLSAAEQQKSKPYAFAVPSGLESKVDFWKAMFTKYGKNDYVFHHRTYPEIIYSVLDLSEYEAKLSGKELARKKRQLLEDETARIQRTLRHLGSGEKPMTPFERRVERMFLRVPERGISKYLDAVEGNQLRFQQGVRERFREGLVRAGRYLYAIEQIFRAEGLPPELGRLPLVESSFDYDAYSSVGAAGIWQFMRSTGSKYLRIGSAIDERRDPILATRAAAHYLKHAAEELDGHWPLAVTSYNHGLSGMVRAVRETGSTELPEIIRSYKAKSFGFASSNFYAEFLAAVDVEKNQSKYFPGLIRETPLYFDEVRLGKQLYIKELARSARISIEEIKWLNQALRDPITSNRTRIPQGYLVKVPPGHGKVLVASVSGTKLLPLIGETTMVASLQNKQEEQPEVLAALATPFPVKTLPAVRMKDDEKSDVAETGSGVYVVKSGDTIGSIAKANKVSREALLKANGISDPKLLKIGRKLSLPSAVSEPVEKPAGGAIAAANVKSYVIKKGDTLKSLSKKFSLSAAELMAFNNIKNEKALAAGSTLYVPEKSDAPGKARLGTPGKSYTVASGDSLAKIAKRFRMDLKKLQQLNPQAGKHLKPGQKLALQ